MADARKRMEAAQGYLMLGMPRQAIDELNEIRSGRGRDWHALQAEARALRREFATAVEHFEAALRTDARNVPLNVGLSRSLIRLGRAADALEALESAYEAHPDDPELLYEFARFHALAEDKMSALSWLGRAIRRGQEFRQRAARDAEFQQFRHDPDFEFLIREVAESDV